MWSTGWNRMIKTIRFEGYKSFASEVDLEIDANVIVLIGRNNSGKIKCT